MSGHSEQNGRYFITKRCIACGTCLAVCREYCIAGGAPPFVIRQSACVRCGICAAKCPVKAIVYEENK
ncbi:MAG: DUF362 domain-containing protein [Oscillospiraceae bacterium]